MREKTYTWTCPYGKVWDLGESILEQAHCVIAGTTGSGKSTLLHSVMFSALIDSPARKQFILIDLKRGIELKRYKNLPHTIAFASDELEAIKALELAVDIMNRRYNELNRTSSTMYSGADIYVIIDELADLMQTAKAKVLDPLSKLMRLGRAARIHVIGATQNPSRSSGGGLPAVIAQNTTSSVCLRVRSAIESRQVCGVKGAELLPHIGYGLYWNPKSESAASIDQVAIPFTTENELNERINYWLTNKPQVRRGSTKGFWKWLWN